MIGAIKGEARSLDYRVQGLVTYLYWNPRLSSLISKPSSPKPSTVNCDFQTYGSLLWVATNLVPYSINNNRNNGNTSYNSYNGNNSNNGNSSNNGRNRTNSNNSNNTNDPKP